MIEKIYGKTLENDLLHFVVRGGTVKNGRTDYVSGNNRLQAAQIRLTEGQTFKPHKHKWNQITTNSPAQECWIVIKGRVKCVYYDRDDTVLCEVVIADGDMSFTINGGHNYISLTDDTIVYEIKSGPYVGQEADKTFIDAGNN